MPKVSETLGLDEALLNLAEQISASEIPIEETSLTSFDNFVQDIFSLSYTRYSFKSWHIRKICNFIDEVLASESKMAEVVLPRYHLKSTLLGVGLSIYRFLTSFGDSLYISYKSELVDFHLSNIKEAVRVNPKLSNFMVDLNPRSQAGVSYKIGSRRVRMFGSGIFAMKRGLHTDCICIAPETKIFKSGVPHKSDGGGYIPISEIKEGEKVKTHLNRFQKVSKIYKRWINEEIYSLQLENKEVIRITFNHPILTNEGWKIVDELTTNDVLLKIKYPNSKLKGKTYEEIHGVEKAKMLRSNKFPGKDYSIGHLSSKKGKINNDIYGKEKSIEIANKFRNTMLSKRIGWNCLQCGRILYLTPNQAAKKKFCSRKCISQFYKNGMGFRFRSKVKNFYKENNPNWKNGKSALPPEPYDIKFDENFKRIIRERDHYICAVCQKRGWVIHHIDYDKKNTCVLNLITTCKKCHAKTNTGDKNRKYWKNFFSVKIAEKYGLISNGTKIVRIQREFYSGYVYNLEVENDNTYVGKGIIFHNCIADDLIGTIENPMVLTELEKAERVFNQEVINIPNKGCPLIVFGTTIDYTDLLFKLRDNDQFMTLWLPAINPDPQHEVLWEDKFDRRTLEMKKQQGGWKAFSSEFLLTPVLSMEAFFTRDELDKVIDKSLVNYHVPGG